MKDTIRRRIVKKELLFLLVIAMLCGASSCKKENTEPNSSNPNVLPPLTHEGKNTFGCLVNGEVWVAYAPFTVGGAIALEGNYNPESGYFQIVATRKLDDKLETIKILSEEVFDEGIYDMRINHLSTRGLIDYKGNFQCSKYFYDTTLISNVGITFFSINEGILSGTFEMDLVNPSCPGDTIKIREGRFDWRMTVY